MTVICLLVFGVATWLELYAVGIFALVVTCVFAGVLIELLMEPYMQAMSD